MAQSDTELAAPPAERHSWPMAAVVWLDLAIVVILVLVSTFAVQTIALTISAQAQGLTSADLEAMSNTERLGLLGIRGVFISTLLQNIICVAVPLLRVGRVRREPVASVGFTARNWPVGIAIGLGMGFLALGVSISLSLLFTQLFDIQQNQAEQFGALLQPNDIFGQALFVLVAIVIAPIGEETLFRGYLFNALRQNGQTGRLVLAYGLSAGLFAIIHLQNVTQGQVALIVPIFAIGLLFAATMHLTKSLIPCILAHAVHNSLSTLVLLFCINTSFPGCPV